jgi:hypothetical protein
VKILSILTANLTAEAEPAKREGGADAVKPRGMTRIPSPLSRPKSQAKTFERPVGKKKRKDRKDEDNLRPMDPGPSVFRRAQVIIDKANVRGVGGLTFTSQSPPGPARLMRLPFYPANDNDAFNGSAGIGTPGDDPMLRITLQNTGLATAAVTSVPIRMVTPIVDYGRYRVVGVQANYQYNYAPKDALGNFAPPYAPAPFPNLNAQVGQVAIAVKNLQVYNGQQLFITGQNNFLDAEEIRALPTLGSSGFTGGLLGGLVPRYQGQRPWQTAAFRQQFIGLRDYPVIDEVAQTTIELQAFVRNLAPGFSIVVPVTVSLVVEMLEDRVFGNILNPSPASRAGANVKVGAKEVGEKNGRDQLALRSLRYVRPKE